MSFSVCIPSLALFPCNKFLRRLWGCGRLYVLKVTTAISPPISLLFCNATFTLPLGPEWALWLIWPTIYGNSHTAPVSGWPPNWPGSIYFLLLESATILRPPCNEKPQPHEGALRSEAPGRQQENPRSTEIPDMWAELPLGSISSRPCGSTWSQADKLPSAALPKSLTHKTACKISCCIKPPGFGIVT